MIYAPPEQEINLIRGDRGEWIVAFMDSPDVRDDPDDWTFRMVFRARQSDSSPELVSLTGDIETEPDDMLRGRPIDVIVTFEMSAEESQDLPGRSIAYFVERERGNEGPTRLFQGRVNVTD